MVSLHGVDGSEVYSQPWEASFTLLWQIQGAISATFTEVGVDKMTVNGPLQRGFNGWIFHSFTHIASPG